MFDLPGEPPMTFPALQQALERSVRLRIEMPPERAAVSVSAGERDYPNGQGLRVETTGGLVRVDPTTGGMPEHLKPPTLVSDRTPGPRFETFDVVSEPLMIDIDRGGRLPLTIRVHGDDIAFDYGRDKDGTWVMAPASGQATAELSVSREELLCVVEATARSEAGARGVTLDRVDAEVTSPSPRTLQVTGTLSGSKKVAFFNAGFTVDFAIELLAEPDETGELVGRASDVRLHGDGAVMNLVLSLAKPTIERVKQTPLPLHDILAMAGVQGLRVRDVRVTAGDKLVLQAEFGDVAGGAEQ